jgi:ADP-heptose:LPS heptosyltransferase
LFLDQPGYLSRWRFYHGWAALVASCRAVITMDTASAHLAAALGVPVVDVFKAHRFEHYASRWSPWCVPARVLRREPIPASATTARRQAEEAALHRAILTALGELIDGAGGPRASP